MKYNSNADVDLYSREKTVVDVKIFVKLSLFLSLPVPLQIPPVVRQNIFINPMTKNYTTPLHI